MNRIATATLTAGAAAGMILGIAAPASADPATVPSDEATAHRALVQGWYEDYFGRQAAAEGPDSTGSGATAVTGLDAQFGPEDGGWYWVQQLDAGAQHDDVVRALTRSSEYARLFTNATYQDFLGRQADPDRGSQFWRDLIRSGGAPEWVAQNVLASPEYESRTDGNSVDEWYDEILQRQGTDPANAGEEDYWTRVAAEQGQLAAVRGIWYSAEAVESRLNTTFQLLLERRPVMGEVDYFFSREVASDIETSIEIAVTAEYEGEATRQFDGDPNTTP